MTTLGTNYRSSITLAPLYASFGFYSEQTFGNGRKSKQTVVKAKMREDNVVETV